MIARSCEPQSRPSARSRLLSVGVGTIHFGNPERKTRLSSRWTTTCHGNSCYMSNADMAIRDEAWRLRHAAQTHFHRSAISADCQFSRQNWNDRPFRRKSHRMVPGSSLAFRGIVTSSLRAGEASRRGFMSVQSGFTTHAHRSETYLRKYLSSYRLERQGFCISSARRKSHHTFALRISGDRHS